MIRKANIIRIIMVVLASLLVISTALCEQITWDCPKCGRTGNTGNYCGTCAYPAPWERENDDSAVSPVDSLESMTQEELKKYIVKRLEEYAIEWPSTDDELEAALKLLPELSGYLTIRASASTADAQPTESTSGTASLPSVPVLSEIYPGSDAHLRKSNDDGFRVYSYTGPSKSFVPSGGYKPYKQRKITVFFEEEKWVLADVLYQTAEERVVYLPKSSFDSIGSIPVVTELDYYIGTATTNIVPSWGPDNRFNSVKSLMINEGTETKVYFQENGFVYAEYECEKGIVRMWLPANNIEIKDATVSYSEISISPAGQSNFR